MNCPMHHKRLSEATNKVKESCELLKFAVMQDQSYAPLLKAAQGLHKRMCARWDKNVKRGRKEGWFK